MNILFTSPTVRVRPKNLHDFYTLWSSKSFTVRIDGIEYRPLHPDYLTAKTLGEAEFGRRPLMLAHCEQNYLR